MKRFNVEMNQVSPKVRIINLPQSLDRRAWMTAHLMELGLQAEFFPAIDGRLLSEAELAAVYDQKKASNTPYGALTRGEVGCALSHRAVWQALLDSGDTGCLVLEDDAQLASDVPEWLVELAELAVDGDVIPFVGTSLTPYYFRRLALKNRWLVYPNQAFIAATAYYITPLAAKRLLQASHPIFFPIDFWYEQPGFKGVTPIRAVWPAAVKPRDESLEASTIGFRASAASKKENGKKSCVRQKISQIRRYIKNRFFVKPVRF